jgi:hypothetical protein
MGGRAVVATENDLVNKTNATRGSARVEICAPALAGNKACVGTTAGILAIRVG